MADEEPAPEPEGGEAAPEPEPEAPAEEAPAAEAEAEVGEAPSEAPTEGGEAPEEPPAEGEAEVAPEGEEQTEAGEEVGAFAEGEAAEGQEAVGEEFVPEEVGEEAVRGEGEESEEARPPSEVDEGATEDLEELEDETGVGAQDSRTGMEEKPSISLLEEQRRARLEKYGSRAKMALGSVIDIRYGGAGGEGGDRKVARFLNTYKLDPDNPFNPEKVIRILETVISEALENLTYDPDKCPKQAKWATSAIRAKVKELEFDRYKIVTIVTIGEKMGQDVLVTCRFLWDYDRDRYTTFSMENTYVYATAQCFGLYYE